MKSGDIVSLNDLQTIFDSNNKIRFKLYSLEYVIEKIDNHVQVYAVDYSTRKSQFNSFKEAMNYFKVRISLIDKDDK